MGNRFFSKVQYGKETVRGTAVAATKILLGQVPAVNSDRKPAFPNENVGVRADAIRSVVHQYLYTNTLSIEHGYFQALPWFFGCGLKGAVVPSEQTPAQADYLWDFTPSMAMAVLNNPDSSTIELGDDTQAFEAEYAMFERIRIGWQVSQGLESSPVKLEADFFSRQLTPTTFTPALSLPAVEPMNGKLSRLYIDPTWAAIGATEKTNILRGADVEILTGVHPKDAGSGFKYFNEHGEGVIMVTANLTVEGLTAANAIMTAHLADPQTFQAVRLKINGGQIGTGLPHSLTLDIGGVWESVSPLGSEDRGDNLHTAVLRGYLDPTGGKLLQVAVSTNTQAY